MGNAFEEDVISEKINIIYPLKKIIYIYAIAHERWSFYSKRTTPEVIFFFLCPLTLAVAARIEDSFLELLAKSEHHITPAG